jgi:hypothetical protein
MIRIKVQYDGLQRTFKLVDPEFKTLLEGDALYDLQIPFVVDENEIHDEIGWATTSNAHA